MVKSSERSREDVGAPGSRKLRGEAQESKRTALHHKLRVLIHPHARRGGHQTTCGAQHFAKELLQGVVDTTSRDLLLVLATSRPTSSSR